MRQTHNCEREAKGITAGEKHGLQDRSEGRRSTFHHRLGLERSEFAKARSREGAGNRRRVTLA